MSTNIYDSHLYDEWVDTLNVNPETKVKYKSYRDELVRFLADKGVNIITREDIIEYINWKKVISTSSARIKASLFSRYVDYLVDKGKLNTNIWRTLNFETLGISTKYDKHRKYEPVQEEKMINDNHNYDNINWDNIFTAVDKTLPTIYTLDVFNEYLDTKNTLSDKSKTLYRIDFNKFLDYINVNKLTNPELEDINIFLIYVRDNRSPKTAYHYVTNYKQFNKWCIEKGYITDNVWDKVDMKSLKITNADVHKYMLERKKLKEPKVVESKTKTTTIKSDVPVFTLSDVAYLLLAIEEKDTATINDIMRTACERVK